MRRNRASYIDIVNFLCKTLCRDGLIVFVSLTGCVCLSVELWCMFLRAPVCRFFGDEMLFSLEQEIWDDT